MMAKKSVAIRAVAFDAFALFDPRSIGEVAQELFGEGGTTLIDAWRRRQFEYAWLRVCAGRYEDFWRVTDDALTFAARSTKTTLDDVARSKLMQAHTALEAWPDAATALAALRRAGIGTALVSNFTEKMLRSCAARASLTSSIDHFLSTDARRTYKPSPEAYALSVDAFGVPKEQIAFVAFAGWDVAGAKWFGHPTFWVNRAGAPPEVLDAHADATGDLSALVDFVMRGA